MDKKQLILDELKRLRISSEMVHIGSWEFNIKDNEIIWSNETFEIFEIDPQNGPPSFEEYLEFFSEIDQKKLLGLIQMAMEEGKNYEIIQNIVFPDKRVKIIKGFGSPFIGEDGKVEKIYGTVLDITEDQKVENNLRQLAFVAEKTDNVVVITDEVGCITWTNHGFTDLTGYTLAEVKGEKPGSFLQGKDTDPETVLKIRNAIKNKESITTEILNYSKSMKPYWLHIDIQPVFNDAGELLSFIAIELDLTERKEYEKKLEETSKKLADALSSREQLFSIIAHDLRAPFQALIGSAKLITEAGTKLSLDEIFSLAKTIVDSSENTLTLLENLLEWSRSQTGDLTVMFTENSLTQVVRDTFKNYPAIAKSKRLNLTFSSEKDVQAYFDKEMISTVIRNLLNNAIKFTPEDGDISCRVSEMDKEVMVEVIDTGIGMSEDYLQKVFMPEVKTTQKGTNGEVGTGLGLVLVKDFVDKNNGRLEVLSQVGVGSHFKIHLPKSKKE